MEPLGTRQYKWINAVLWKTRNNKMTVKRLNTTYRNPMATYNEDHREVCFPQDHRKKLDEEVIFDLEAKYGYNRKKLFPILKDICWYIKQNSLTPIPCTTGGSGYHLHVFTKSKEDARDIASHAVTCLGLKPLLNRVLDPQLLYGNHHIRMIGGRNIGKRHTRYKSVIRLDKPYLEVYHPNRVRFPRTIWHYDFSSDEIK